MNILIVGIFKKTGPLKRFVEEGEKLGHKVTGCKTSDLILKSTTDSFEAYIKNTPLKNFDLIYLYAGIESKKVYEWYIAADYTKKNFGTKIVNEVVLDPKLKYYPVQSWFFLKGFDNQIPQPKTYVVFDGSNFGTIFKDLSFPLILKLSDTHQGKGVFKIENEEEAKKIISENPGKVYLFREFIPSDGDVRVFVVGGKAISAMKRTSAKGDFRNNISQGGTGENFDLDNNFEIKDLAEKCAQTTGIEIAGVDVLIDKNTNKPYVIEVNVGPQFKGLEKYTGVNAAYEQIKYFEQKN